MTSMSNAKHAAPDTAQRTQHDGDEVQLWCRTSRGLYGAHTWRGTRSRSATIEGISQSRIAAIVAIGTTPAGGKIRGHGGTTKCVRRSRYHTMAAPKKIGTGSAGIFRTKGRNGPRLLQFENDTWLRRMWGGEDARELFGGPPRTVPGATMTSVVSNASDPAGIGASLKVLR